MNSLKIEYLELYHFENIFTGLKANKLIIDFSKMTNVVCLLIGRNGRGKTSLLSYMTPFATLGNLDVRDSNKLIIPGKKGYKKIIFKDDESNVYEIEHFYTPSDDTFTIKSYFKLNGEELNENGNVQSFKRLVADFLDIEMDYLKLIRMGDNVQNLIRAKATERKTFMGKILEDVNIYLKQHKMISQKQRDVKVLLSHITDKISKLDVVSVEAQKERIETIQDQIKVTEKQVESLQKEIVKIQCELEVIHFPEDGDVKIRTLRKKVDRLSTVLDIAKNKTVPDIEKEIEIATNKKNKVENAITASSTRLTILVESLDKTLQEVQKLKLEIQKEKDSVDIESLKEYEKELRKKTNDFYRTKFDEVKLPCTKEEFDAFVVTLKNIQRILNRTYEFGRGPIEKVLDALETNRDVENIISSGIIAAEAKNHPDSMSLLDRLIEKYKDAKVPVECDTCCIFRDLHKELMRIKDTKPSSAPQKYTAEFYRMMEMAHTNLKEVFSMISEQKELIERCPLKIREMFEVKNLFSHIRKGEYIFDEAILNEYMLFFTEFSNWENAKAELKEVEDKISHIEQDGKLSFLEKQYESKTKEVCSMQEKIEEEKSELAENKERCLSLEKDMESLCDMKEALLNFEENEGELKSLEEDQEKYYVFQRELSLKKETLRKLEALKDTQIREKFQQETRLSEYKALVKEHDKNSEVYQDYEHLKYALSNKSGIPLEYIKIFLRDTRAIANELLDIIYDGDMYLDKFDINADEFRIPYVKEGYQIDDVSKASQGEQSFFNMAISSALRTQAMTNYNIALYDEVDSMFDDTNRQKFIPVLDKQLELNHVRQAILITHNMMFRTNYPVDIIDLDHPETSTIPIEIS